MSNYSINTPYFDDSSLNRYLHEIGKETLLTKEKEVELAREIRKGSVKALDTLIKSNLRFVVSVAKGYQNQGMSLCDLINEGNIGLIQAAKRFDETKGYKFITYAVWWIRQAILTALAKESHFINIPINRAAVIYKIGRTSRRLEQEFGRAPSTNEIADELDFSPYKVMDTLRMSFRHLSLDTPFDDDEDSNLLDILSDKYHPSPDETAITNSLTLEIEKLLSMLPNREAEVISLYYGINRDNPLTLEEISMVFKLTCERVRQIKDKALNHLRHYSRSEKLRTYFLEEAS
jgi:RNA polymerase primary sigma factor